MGEALTSLERNEGVKSELGALIIFYGGFVNTVSTLDLCPECCLAQIQNCGSSNLLVFAQTLQTELHDSRVTADIQGVGREIRVVSTPRESLCPLPSGSAGKTLEDSFLYY